MTTSRLLAATAASALVVIGLVACAPPEKKTPDGQTESGVNAKEATSAADFGGMDGLVKAAKAEGDAQCDCAAAGLGQLQGDHRHLLH